MKAGDRIKFKTTGERGTLIEQLITEKGREAWYVITASGGRMIWAEKDMEVLR